MKYPRFNERDLATAHEDGNYEVIIFSQYLKDLINLWHLDNPTEIGVAKLVSTQGTENLSDKQIKVLEIILSKHGQIECNQCGETLEWNELIEAKDNGGYCSSCAHIRSKDD